LTLRRLVGGCQVFFVKLSLDVDDETNQATTVLGKRAIQEITILNDDRTYSFWCIYLFIYLLFILAQRSRLNWIARLARIKP